MLDSAYWLLLAFPLVPLVITCINLASWRRGTAQPNQNGESPLLTSSPLLTNPPRVSVLIPARNEASNIEAAVRSALASQAPSGAKLASEVLVYDDGSTDETALLVGALSKQDPRVRLIQGVPLSPGWIGKPHACQGLFEQAQAEILLFMDADVRLEPNGLARMLSLMSAPASGRVISAVPRQVVGSFMERLVMPLLILTYTAWLPLRLIEIGRSKKTVAANGQLMLMRREDCRTLGGFKAVRNEIVDDVAFCRHAKANGLRVVFGDGTHMASCRMYNSASEVWRGFSKNLYEGLGNPLVLVSVIALHLACFIAPYGALLYLSLGSTSGALWLPAMLGVAANVLLRLCLAIRFRQPWEGVVLHPIAVLTLCALALNSYVWAARGRIEWAGRSYAGRARRAKEAA